MTENDQSDDYMREVIEKISSLPRDISFEKVIRALYGVAVIPFDTRNQELSRFLKNISCAMKKVCENIWKNPLHRQRPNEIGNAIEPFVLEALKDMGFKADIPQTQIGRRKYAGYPDIRIESKYAPIYLEVKTYNQKTIGSTQRSFYLSPPFNERDKKVVEDAFHLLVGFAMTEHKDGGYVPISYRIYDLYGLRCSLKAEFQSNNQRLYEGERLLEEWIANSAAGEER